MGKKILSVDNEPDTVALVKDILIPVGYNVIGAYSGKEGLEKAKTEKPDLILLDIMMPDMSGWDVFQKIRKDKLKTKVAFLSVVEVSAARKRNLMKEGLADYILKPFTSDELIKKIKKLIG